MTRVRGRGLAALRRGSLGIVFGTMVAAGAQAACPGGSCSAPGAGSVTTDCIVEYDGVTPNQPTKRPKNVRCVDGDPACDADGVANGSCRFDLTVCLNNADPAFPTCTSTDVASFAVANRPVTSPKYNGQLAAIAAAVAGLGLPNASNVCTAAQQLNVNLRNVAGTYHRSTVNLRSTAKTTAGTRDPDHIRFQCLPSPTAPGPGTTFARAEVVTKPSQLIEGPLAKGRLGDLRLYNDKIQVIVKQPGRTMFGIAPYGGNIIDADRIRPDGTEKDNFEGWSPGINVENTANYTSVVVLNDGTNGQPAVVRATGPDDLLDFVNPSSVVAGFGFTFPASADDRDLPVDIQTDYTLAAGTEYVTVDTTVTNLGGTSLPIYFADYLNGSGKDELFQPTYGFGEPLVTTEDGTSAYVACTAGMCDPQDMVAYDGVADGAGVSYGYILPADFNGTTTFTTSGVTVPLLGQDAVLTLIGGSFPNFTLAASGNPGDSLTFTRYFAVGDGSVASIATIRNQILGVATGTLSGTVTANGTGVADTAIAVTATPVAGPHGLGAPAKNVVNHVRTAADGTYSMTLPPGSYTVQANKPGRLTPTPSSAAITITTGGTTTQDFAVDDPSLIRVHVVDENNAPIPAKVQLVGFDPSPDPRNSQSILGAISDNMGVFDEEFEDGLVQGIANVTFAGKDGDTGDFEIEPGTYQLAVSHGLRYSASLQPVTITAGLTTTVNVQLARVMPTPGYVASDFHLHSIQSPDSEVTMADRITTQIAEGNDFITPSDHDNRVDFRPTILSMGVDDLIACAQSAEITTFDYGHFNSWPVTRDPSQRNGGSVDWGRAGIAPGMDFPSFGSFNLTPQEIYAAAHADPRGPLIQINHMRSHFNTDGLDIDTATTPPSSHTPGSARRLDPSITNYFSDDFDALEVWIGTDGRTGDQQHFVGENLGDWFNMLNQGITRSGVADSDSHQKRTTQMNARTLVASSVTDPALLWTEDSNLAQSVVMGHATGTNAPFMTVDLATPLGTGGLGVGQSTMVATNDGSATITVNVESPLWAPFDRIQFYVNNAPQAYDHDGKPATRKRYRVIPNVEKVAGVDFALNVVNDFPSIPGASHYQATTTLNLTGLTQDTWVVVLVRGTDGVSQPLFPVLPNSLVAKACANNPCKSCNTNADCPSSTCSVSNQTLAEVTDGNLNQCGILALAFSNPLYIDVNQNGLYDPPGVMLTP